MCSDIQIEVDTVRLRPAISEVNRLWADNTKAKDLCGWEPSYAGLQGFSRGIRKTIDWFLEPENLAHYKANNYNV